MSNIHILRPLGSVESGPLLLVADVLVSEAPPPLLGLVSLVGGEEGHAVGPEVGVEVRGLVETPAAHLAAQVPLPVLALGLRGGRRRAVGRARRARGAAVHVALGVPNAVSDEAVPAQGAGRREADAALQALEGGGVRPVLGDVALKLRSVFGGEAAGNAAEDIVFLLHFCRRHGPPGSLCSAGTLLPVLCGIFFLFSCSAARRTAFAVLLRRAAWTISSCGCTLPGQGGTLRGHEEGEGETLVDLSGQKVDGKILAKEKSTNQSRS